MDQSDLRLLQACLFGAGPDIDATGRKLLMDDADIDQRDAAIMVDGMSWAASPPIPVAGLSRRPGGDARRVMRHPACS